MSEQRNGGISSIQGRKQWRTMSTINTKMGPIQVAVLRELYLLMEPHSVRDIIAAMGSTHNPGRLQSALSTLISRHLVFRSPPNYRCKQPSSRIETYGITPLGTRVIKELLASTCVADAKEERYQAAHACFPACQTERVLCALMLDVYRLRPDWRREELVSAFVLTWKPKNWRALLDCEGRKRFDVVIRQLKINPATAVDVPFHDLSCWLSQVDFIEARKGLPDLPEELASLLIAAVERCRKPQETTRSGST